jgi:signal transduction histidine kinase
MRIIKQMSKTIDDFRDFFKNDKKMQMCALIDVVHQAQDIIEPTLASRHINLKINAQSEQPVPCLRNELSQVILNLIANAMDALVLNHIEHGEITITIEEHPNRACMIIDDNAGGIPEEIIEKIFEPYFTTKSNSNGTGIGLYMSKSIIEEHMSGKLEVYNTLSGASFKITLPTDIKISDIECHLED